MKNTIVKITGPTASGKTLIAMATASAYCKLGRRVLFIGEDSISPEIMRKHFELDERLLFVINPQAAIFSDFLRKINWQTRGFDVVIFDCQDTKETQGLLDFIPKDKRPLEIHTHTTKKG